MHLYQCPACDCLPVRYKKKPRNPPHCVRCDRELEKCSQFSKGYRWATALALFGIGCLFLPHVFDALTGEARQNPLIMGLTGQLPPEEAMERIVNSIDPDDLLAKLEDADLEWQPREELLPDGAIRYVYKRRAGEPELTLSELRSKMDSPPSFDEERIEILALLSTLKEKGVRVLLTPTEKKGAAAEWSHRDGIVRIKPQVIEQGSLDFLRTLNHEAIHVAQSCKAGSLRARPKALGLPIENPQKLKKILNDPIYSGLSVWEHHLEMEAYHSQNEHGKARQLVERLCRPA
jgi:hypothetical protein